MAPLSRGRVGPGGAPTALNALYYAQRASAGLIVAEAAEVSSNAHPGERLGMNAASQIPGWRLVTDAVHAAGGRIVLQLRHAPQNSFSAGAVVAAFGAAARRALEAGFDGVEIHTGPRDLLGPLLKPDGWRRQRADLLIAVLDATAPVFGAERVGIRLMESSFAGRGAFLERLASRLQARNLGYLHLVLQLGTVFPATLRAHYRGSILLAGGLNRDSAEEVLQSGQADLVAFGMPFVATPDLVDVLRQNASPAQADPATLRQGGARGYTDYPHRAGMPVQ